MGYCLIWILPFLLLLNTLFIGKNSQELSPIKIGSVLDLSMSAKETGQGMKNGIELYFAKVNANGGVLGRKIDTIFFDDSYEPLKSAKGVRQLISDPDLIAFIANTGAPNMEVTVPIVNEKKIVLYAASTGAMILHKTPPDPYVFNFRESHLEEAQQLVEGILSAGYKPEDFAILTQNDPFGDAIFQGVSNAFSSRGFNPNLLPHGRYTYNTLNVEDALATILTKIKKPPKVILSGGNAYANAKFINLAHEKFPEAIYIVIGGYLSLPDLKNKENLTIITNQLIPPLSFDSPALIEYRADLKKYGNGQKENYYSLQGYLAAKLLTVALSKAIQDNKLTREGLVEVFESLHDVDIGIGTPISFGKEDHQALERVWPMQLKDGEWIPLENWSQIRKIRKK